MTRLGYHFYYLFVVCSFTNAVFFWLFLPETSRVPLEKMDAVFEGPWIVPFTKKLDLRSNNAEHMDGKSAHVAEHVEM